MCAFKLFETFFFVSLKPHHLKRVYIFLRLVFLTGLLVNAFPPLFSASVFFFNQLTPLFVFVETAPLNSFFFFFCDSLLLMLVRILAGLYANTSVFFQLYAFSTNCHLFCFLIESATLTPSFFVRLSAFDAGLRPLQELRLNH